MTLFAQKKGLPIWQLIHTVKENEYHYESPFLLFNTGRTTIKPSGSYPSVLGTALVTISVIQLDKAVASHGCELRVRLVSWSHLSPSVGPFTPISFYISLGSSPPTAPRPSAVWLGLTLHFLIANICNHTAPPQVMPPTSH